MVAENRQMKGPSSTSTAKPPSWLGACRSETVRECLRLALLKEEEDRLIQLYLQTESYKRASRTMPGLVANIILEAIDAFFAEAGLRIEATLGLPGRYDSLRAGPAETRLIETAPGRYGYILSQGFVFFRHNDGGRAILKLETDKSVTEVSLLTQCLDEHDFFATWESYAYANAYLRGQRFYASGEFVDMAHSPRLADVRLPDDVAGLVRRLALGFADQSTHFAARRLPTKRGLMLAGPPGTGKTMLCRALANEFTSTVIWGTARHFECKAEKIAVLWNLARTLAPTMLILEDIDLFGEDRDVGCPSGVLGEIMNQMDGADDNRSILTIATTNRLDVVEAALRNRPGRFDRVIRFEGLSESARRQLLMKLLVSDTFEPKVLDQLTSRSDGFTGAQVMELARTVIELAYEGRPTGANGSITVTPQLASKALGEMNGDKKKVPMGFMTEGRVDKKEVRCRR